MNDYLINYKIATTAELIKNFDFDGYNFSSYDPDWWKSDAWIASKVINAESAGIARARFVEGLIPVIERCCAVSQCAFRIVLNSYFIYKQSNNPEKVVYIYFVRATSHTGLHFDDKELQQLTKFNSIQNKKGLFYIMEASNAATFYTRLTMLMAAAEGFAGELLSKGQNRTDQKALENILGSQLYQKLYAYGTGLRHKLLHGNIPTNEVFDGLTEEIYDRLIAFLRDNFKIEFEENVVHPQRDFKGNYEAAGTFEKLKDESGLNLVLIEKAFDQDNPDKRKVWSSIFDGYVESPDNY